MTATPWLVLGALLAVAGAATAQSIAPFEDASGNERHLTERDTVTNISDGAFDKFGAGVDLSEGWLEREDPIFNLGGGFSLTTSFTWHGDFTRVAEYIDTGGGEEWVILATGSSLSIQMDGFTVCSVSGLDPGDYSIFYTHEDGTLQDSQELHVYDSDGFIDSCSGTRNAGGDDGTLQIGGRSVPFEVWEVRTWDTNIAESTLDAIADPTNPDHALEAEGTESALYFLEEITLPGDPDAINTVNLWTIDNGDGATKDVYAQAMNQDGEPVESPGGVDLFITRTNGFTVEYYDLTTDAWSASIANNTMDERSSTLFNTTMPSALTAESSVRLTATARFDTNPQNADDLAFGDMEQQTVIPDGEPEASVLSDTAFHEFTGLTSLEWALFGLLAVLGVIVWSRSMDLVVRSFGAILPVIAGALLLGFGADQGFGALWNGVIAFSVVMLLSGVYMLTRLFLDAFLDSDEEAA